MGALKIRVSKPTSSERYLAEAQREERATLQEVSMDILGKPDIRLQARSEIDMGWVRQLDASYEIHGEIEPVVIFWDDKIEKYWLADGFHRHALHKARRLPSIKAWVIPGTFKDAAMYAASTNQRGGLPRKENDYKKIVFMLFGADHKWIEKPVREISGHTGISTGTVTKWRAVYCQEQGIPLPVSARVHRGQGKVSICESTSRGKSFFVGTVRGGKTIYLGSTREAAEEKAKQIEIDLKEHSSASLADTPADLSVSSLLKWFPRRAVFVESCKNPPNVGLGQAFVGDTFVAVSAVLDKAESLQSAVGRVMLNKVERPQERMVVVCDKFTENQAVKNARKLGIEFLTPDELVASIHGNPEANVRFAEKQPRSKLDEKDILEIRARHRNGETPAAIARDYTVSDTNIRFIVQGKSWTHVSDDQPPTV